MRRIGRRIVGFRKTSRLGREGKNIGLAAKSGVEGNGRDVIIPHVTASLLRHGRADSYPIPFVGVYGRTNLFILGRCLHHSANGPFRLAISAAAESRSGVGVSWHGAGGDSRARGSVCSLL